MSHDASLGRCSLLSSERISGSWTLRQGIEVAIKEAIPEILNVVDPTDHASGEDPYFESGKK